MVLSVWSILDCYYGIVCLVRLGVFWVIMVKREMHDKIRCEWHLHPLRIR